MTHHFQPCGSEQCNMITPLSFATGPSLNEAERQPGKSNQYENNHRGQQMLKGLYITMTVNRASMICGLGSVVIHQ